MFHNDAENNDFSCPKVKAQMENCFKNITTILLWLCDYCTVISMVKKIDSYKRHKLMTVFIELIISLIKFFRKIIRRIFAFLILILIIWINPF